MSDASVAQYGPPSTTCVACLTPGPVTHHPNTGLDLMLPLLVGVVLIVIGVGLRVSERV